MGRLKIKDIINTSTEEIKSSKVDKSLLLEWTKQAVDFAKRRKTKVDKWIQSQDSMLPIAYREQKQSKKMGKYTAKRLDFNIDMKKVDSKQGYSYLLSLFTQVRDFLSSKTSTITGWKKTLNKFKKTLEQSVKIDWGDREDTLYNKKVMDKVFNLYNELREENINWRMLSSTNALKTIIETVNSDRRLSYTTLLNKLYDVGAEKYTEQIKKINTRLIESGANKFNLNGDLI